MSSLGPTNVNVGWSIGLSSASPERLRLPPTMVIRSDLSFDVGYASIIVMGRACLIGIPLAKQLYMLCLLVVFSVTVPVELTMSFLLTVIMVLIPWVPVTVTFLCISASWGPGPMLLSLAQETLVCLRSRCMVLSKLSVLKHVLLLRRTSMWEMFPVFSLLFIPALVLCLKIKAALTYTAKLSTLRLPCARWRLLRRCRAL